MFCVSVANAIVVTIADNLVLQQEAGPGIQQASQGPCVIGDPSCNSNTSANISTFGLLPNGNVVDYSDEFSPFYNVGRFRAEAGDMFSIGIDINVTGNGASDHRLRTFVVEIDGVQTFAHTSNDPLADYLNAGNGFSDWRLTGFDLTGVADDSIIRFGLDLGDVDAGGDQFFVIAAPPPQQDVVEPSSVFLLSLGLLGLRLARRK